MTALLRRGYVWISVYLALLVLPLVVAAVGERPPGRPFWVELSIALGFVGLAILLLQFVVSARVRAFTWPFGIDVVLQFHRQIAFLGLALVLVHPLILAAERTWNLLNPLDAGPAQAYGMLAVLAILVQMVISIWRIQLRMSYGLWHVIHAVVAVAIIGFSFLHVAEAGAYLDTTWKAILWTAMGLAVVGLVSYTRIIKPFIMLRRPYRVANVQEERGGSWTIELEPESHDGVRFRPGQFAWISLGESPFVSEEHPFSFSSAPPENSGRVAFTIKELGDFTSRVKETPIGTRAYLDGPYGAFTFERFPAPGYVFIAGGIGITPIMSMLRSLAGDRDQRRLVLFNANPDWESITYREEFEELQQVLDLEVIHVLDDPPGDWDGETGFVTAELLDRRLPDDRANLQYFVCGPPVMLDAVRDALLEIGIPLSHIQIEEFALA